MNDPPFANQMTINRLALFGPRHDLRALVRAALPDGYKQLPIADHICSRLAVAYPDSLPPPDAVAFAARHSFVECGLRHRVRAAREIPASLHASELFDQVLMAAAAEYPTADPPAATVEAIARRQFEHFRTVRLTRLAATVLSRREGFGVGPVELAERATARLFLMKRKNFFAPGRVSFETWLVYMVLRPALTCLLREDRNIRQVTRRVVTADGGVVEYSEYRMPVPVPADRPDTTDPVAAVVDREQVDYSLGELTPSQRELFWLRHSLELPWTVIAGLLPDDQGTVSRAVSLGPPANADRVNQLQQRLSRALKRFRPEGDSAGGME